MRSSEGRKFRERRLQADEAELPSDLDAGTIAVIPARWGSVRFPGKPLHLIAGKPLIQHVWERCMETRTLTRVIVATDDTRIAGAVRQFGGEVVMTSPEHRSGTDRIAEVLRGLRNSPRAINIQGDEPLVSPKLIDHLVRVLERTRCEMVTAATPFGPDESPDNPNAVKVVCRLDGSALYFSRSRIPFARDGGGGEILRHIGIYGYRRDFLLRFVRWAPSPLEETEQLEQLRALQHGAVIRVVRAEASAPGVDTPEDAATVERMMQARGMG